MRPASAPPSRRKPAAVFDCVRQAPVDVDVAIALRAGSVCSGTGCDQHQVDGRHRPDMQGLQLRRLQHDSDIQRTVQQPSGQQVGRVCLGDDGQVRKAGAQSQQPVLQECFPKPEAAADGNLLRRAAEADVLARLAPVGQQHIGMAEAAGGPGGVS